VRGGLVGIERAPGFPGVPGGGFSGCRRWGFGWCAGRMFPGAPGGGTKKKPRRVGGAGGRWWIIER